MVCKWSSASIVAMVLTCSLSLNQGMVRWPMRQLSLRGAQSFNLWFAMSFNQVFKKLRESERASERDRVMIYRGWLLFSVVLAL